MPIQDLQELFKRRLESEKGYEPGQFESDFEKYMEYSERLLNKQCLMCGGSVGEMHETVEGPKGEEHAFTAEAPLCPPCLSKPHPEILKQFAEQWDLDIEPGHVGPEFYEETMDPKEIEEKYRGVSEEELSERSGPVSMETARKMEPETPPQEMGEWMEGIEEGRKYNPRPKSLFEARTMQELVKIANELDQKGLYDEASEVDAIIRLCAEEYQEYDPNPWPPEPWEAAMMEMDISPEVQKKEHEYKKREIPTDPKEVEELIVRTKMLLKDIDYPEGEIDIWQPQEESKDVGEKWYFGTEGEPEETYIEPEDMAEDKPQGEK
jgi:hypothetical protein